VRTLLFVFLILVLSSCTPSSEREYRNWIKGGIALGRGDARLESPTVAAWTSKVEAIDRFLSDRAGFIAGAPLTIMDGQTNAKAQILIAMKPDGKEWLMTQGRPFRLVFDPREANKEHDRLIRRGFSVDFFPTDRIRPFSDLTSPLWLEWSLRPFGYTAETIALNRVDPSIPKPSALVDAAVQEFLAVTYGPNSVELTTYIERRIDESAFATLMQQLQENLREVSDESQYWAYIDRWLSDYINHYPKRFLTNRFFNLSAEDLSRARILLSSWRDQP